jgi:hypothetical protein
VKLIITDDAVGVQLIALDIPIGSEVRLIVEPDGCLRIRKGKKVKAIVLTPTVVEEKEK